MPFPGNVRKPQISPISPSQKLCQEEKSTNCDHNLISSEGGQDTSACQISGHSLHAFSGKCPETFLDGWTDRKTGYGWYQTNRPMYGWKDGILGFGWRDGRMDREPENIMPLVPKGKGITNDDPTKIKYVM